MRQTAEVLSDATILPISEPPASDKNHLHALTGLRILVAVAVYFSHVPPPAGMSLSLATGMASGYYGVTFFFTLSGFVLAINYFPALERPTGRDLWLYGVARFARVYPLYLLVLLFVIARMSKSGVPTEHWMEHVLALQAWSGSFAVAFLYNSPAWSVSVEFFLYAMFPLLVVAIARLDRGLGWLLLAAGLVATVMAAVAMAFTVAGLDKIPFADPSSAHRWIYRNPVCRLGDFILGILAARIYLRTRHSTRANQFGVALIVIALCATAAFATTWSFLFSAASWDVAYALPAFALVLGLALAPESAVSRFLSIPALVFLGEASYAFYLVHFPMLIMMGESGWAKAVTLSTVVAEVFQLGLVIALAVGLHIIVEKPCRTWLRRVLTMRWR